MELPFNTIEFIDTWMSWLEYKKDEFKFEYKTKHSMKAALKKINRLSKGDEEKAIEIIEESMANGWKGFFALKSESKSPSLKKLTAAEKIRQEYGI